MYFPLVVGVLCLFLFCYALLCYPGAYHSTYTTNISNVPLKKLLSHSAKKGEFTVFLSKELLAFSKENKLYTVAWQNKAETSHRDEM